MEDRDIKSLTREELREVILARGEKAFRADQVYSWMHERLASGFCEMTNLPKALREALEEEYDYTNLEIVEVQRSRLDGTCKYLFRLADGNVIESVLMRYHHGNSVCISSQAGCRMGCRFCASTIGGLVRNLKASEMLDQIYRIQKDTGERVSNVVVMEPGSLWIIMRICCGLSGFFRRSMGFISASAISPYRPAESRPGSGSWRMRICRLLWPSLCMQPRRKSGRS